MHDLFASLLFGKRTVPEENKEHSDLITLTILVLLVLAPNSTAFMHEYMYFETLSLCIFCFKVSAYAGISQKK
jgi:hypothetical protein